MSELELEEAIASLRPIACRLSQEGRYALARPLCLGPRGVLVRLLELGKCGWVSPACCRAATAAELQFLLDDGGS